jgi:hypothetical protein
VHLAQGGITTSEVAAWLRSLDMDGLYALAQGRLALIPESVFVLPDVAVDIAETELVERHRADRRASVLPPPAAAVPVTDALLEPPPEFVALLGALAAIDAPLPVADAVIGESFCAASYRLSLLPFLGEANVDPELAPLAGLPLHLAWHETAPLAPVGRAEVAAMTPGVLKPAPGTS